MCFLWWGRCELPPELCSWHAGALHGAMQLPPACFDSKQLQVAASPSSFASCTP